MVGWGFSPKKDMQCHIVMDNYYYQATVQVQKVGQAGADDPKKLLKEVYWGFTTSDRSGKGHLRNFDAVHIDDWWLIDSFCLDSIY